MHATVVMLIIMGGLGCQNSPSLSPPAPLEAQAVSAQPPVPATAPLENVGPTAPLLSDVGATAPLGDPGAADTPVPPPYPVYSGGPFAAFDRPEDDSFHTCMRNTFCSFFIGKDPGIPTARQIEAAYQAGQYNQ